MCYNCHDRGHFARDCTVKLCKRCRGRGHEEDKCPSPADMKSNLAVEMPDSDSDSTTSSVAASGFVAIDTAGCGSLPGKCKELPAELPKGEANRLERWARHGEAVTSS